MENDYEIRRDGEMPPSDLCFSIEKSLKKYDSAKGFVHLAGFDIDERWMPWLVSALAKLEGLRAASFSGITDVGLSLLADGRLKSLAQLDLTNCSRITDAGVASLATGKLPALARLDLTNCNKITDGSLASLANGTLSMLAHLDLWRCNKITDLGLASLSNGTLSVLAHLNLRHCNEITDLGLASLANGKMPALTHLDLVDCDKVADSGLSWLANGKLPALTHLDLTNCSRITDVGLSFLANGKLPALAHLYLKGCEKITDVGLSSLTKGKLPSLGHLHLRGCDKITEVGLSLLAKGDLPRLHTLDIRNNRVCNPHVVIDLCEKILKCRAMMQEECVTIAPRIRAEGNPLRWPEMIAPISDETLHQQDPAKLRQLLLNSRFGEPFIAARVTMAGLGMSGKTRLSRWLVDHPMKHENIDPYDRTIGIEPLETQINGKQFGQVTMGNVALTVLDCGGQQEQLQSHHNLVYKASGRSLFILCLHAGKDFRSREGNRADYYLRMLQSYRAYGDRPLPVLIVVTHGDTPERKLHIPEGLTEEYSSLHIVKVDPYLGDIGKEVTDVQRAIAGFLANMPQIKSILPPGVRGLQAATKKKFQLDEPLPFDPRERRIKCASMSAKQFVKVCTKCGLTDESLHGDYLRHLASLGTVIAPGVEKTIGPSVKQLSTVVSDIFNPRYVNQHIYGLLMNNRVREEQGFMLESWLRDAIPNEQERQALLSLLKRYLIVFEWKHRNEEGLLIPDLLPERLVPTKWSDALCGALLHFDVRRVFLGEHHFFEFLSRQKHFIKRLDLSDTEKCQPICPVGVFRNEVCLCRAPCEALVQIDIIESRIDVAVRGGTLEEAGYLREQIIGNLTYLDPPGAVEVERWQANPAKTGPKRRVVGKGKYDLAELQKRIEEWVERHGFPWPQKTLADRFRCPPNSLSVIVNRSDILKGARDLQRLLSATKGRKHQDIEGAVLNNTKNFQAPDPDHEAAVQEQYDLMREFSHEEILSELCSYLPTEKKRQEARKLVKHQKTQFLRRTLAVHRVNSCET